MPKKISPHVYRLGFLSFFNDLTSDFIVPFLPVYLSTLGLGAQFLGMMEGLANAVMHLTTLVSGTLADRWGKYKTLTWMGYALCAISRPFMAIPFAPVILFVRLVDRFGKGLRTAPRNAMITHLTSKEHWGHAFGIHRTMDHAGALLGAMLGAWILWKYSISWPWLFILASIPSILSAMWIPKKLPEIHIPTPKKPVPLSWKSLSPKIKPYLGLIFFVACSTPSDLFLLAKMKELGMTNPFMPVAWAHLTFFTLISAYLGGRLSDHISRRKILAIGWLIFAGVFLGLAFCHKMWMGWILLALYGLQSGLVEPAERTYAASLVAEHERGNALGWYSFAYGMGLLPASLIFGQIWSRSSSKTAFLIYAAMTLVSVFCVGWLPDSRKKITL